MRDYVQENELEAEFSIDFSVLSQAINAYENSTYRLVVMGQVNKGKSSFINALLGLNGALPTDTNASTCVPIKTKYGAEPTYRVILHEGERLTQHSIAPEQIHLYATEALNPHNEKNVHTIEICIAHPLLESGSEIVDTPGLDSTYGRHDRITWEILSQADAICFAYDSVNAELDSHELAYITRIQDLDFLTSSPP